MKLRVAFWICNAGDMGRHSMPRANEKTEVRRPCGLIYRELLLLALSKHGYGLATLLQELSENKDAKFRKVAFSDSLFYRSIGAAKC